MRAVLHQREQLLADAQGSPDSVVGNGILPPTGSRFSDELYRMLGLQPDGLLTHAGYLDHIHPDDRPALTDRLSAALSEGDAFHVEARVLGADGQVLWVEARGEVVRDEAGTPSLMRGTVQDITASKLTAEALAVANARYRMLQVMASAANDASRVEEVLQVAVDEICTRLQLPVGLAYMPPERPAARDNAR